MTARQFTLTDQAVYDRLRLLVAKASTEDEARGLAAELRAFVRRVRARQWEPYPWQHPHVHPEGWVSLRAPGKAVCDARCASLPPAPIGVHEAWLQRGGRGTGKTEGAAHYVTTHAEGPACDTRVPGGHRLTIVAPTQPDAVSSCVTGVSGLQSINPAITVTTTKEGTIVRWPNGTVARVLGANDAKDVNRARAWTNVCVAEGSLVQTQGGPLPIEDVRPGHYVWTRTGLRRVVRAECTGIRPVVRVQAEGADVWVTPDHPVARLDGTFTRADAGGSVLVWLKQPWSTTGSPGLSETTATTGAASGYSTATSTSVRWGRSPRGGMSTTPTSTNSTTRPATWWPWTQLRMPSCTSRARDLTGTLLGAVRLLPLGPSARVSASSAEQRPRTELPANPSSAQHGVATQEPRHEHGSSVCAACAEQGSPAPDGTAPAPVARPAAVSPPTRHARVYDLAVEGHHEFYAGGLLVGNCLWWLEEAAAQPHLAGMLEQAPYTLRLGETPHMVVTTTPVNRPEVVALIEGTTDPDLQHITRAPVQTWGRTQDADRLPDPVRESYERRFRGTTRGRQELDGDLIGDVAGALWVQKRLETVDGRTNPDDRPGIDNDRVPLGSVGWRPHGTIPRTGPAAGISPNATPPEQPLVVCERVAVGVDPAGGSTENGISVVGTAQGIAYTLADLSLQAGPDTWGRVAVLAAYEYGAEGIALERTYGGDQTEHVIATAAEALGLPMPAILKAPTQEGKKERAVPVQALAQNHRVKMVGHHAKLEGELTTWVEDETPESPNRLDSWVHVIRHLLVRARPAKVASPTGRARIDGGGGGRFGQ